MVSGDTQVHRLSYQDVLQMVEAGVLRAEDRVELVDGVLVDVSPPGPEHSATVAWLTRHFGGVADDRELRVQDLLVVAGGFLVPDLMVIEPMPRNRHPATAHLVVEVAVTTQRHDAWKAGRYAAAAVGEYWLVDLANRTLSVHRGPRAEGYEEVAAYVDGDRVQAPVAAPSVSVTELLGAPTSGQEGR